MSISTQFTSGTYTRRVAEIKSQTIVEIRFSGQDIGDAAAVYPQVSLSSCEVSSGRVTYSGRLVCTLVYSDESGKLCRVQKGAEFSHFADNENLAPAQTGHCFLTSEKYQLKREGSLYVVAVVVGAEISVYAPAERSVLSSADGLVLKKENKKLYTAVTFSGESEVEDEFDCTAEDVLIPAAEALVLDCNCRSGAVEVSGEIYLSMLAIRSGKPVGLDRVIPFKCEVPCRDALLSKKAVCRAEVKEISLNASVNEENGKCNVELAATLGFAGLYYDDEEISVAEDAFSPTSELKLTFAEENFYPCGEIKVYSERVGGLCATKAKLDYTCTFLAVALPHADFSRSGEGIEGSVTAVLLYEQNSEIRSTEINLPFSIKLAESLGDVRVAVYGLSLKQRAEGECEAEGTVKVTISECEQVTVKYVSDAAEVGEKESADCAISVYIPAAGDSLWDTAKKLSQSPESITQSNPELSFPLSGKERILIFRPKQV